MQTFLPYPDFTASAQVIDYRRLGKQRVETWQILRALAGETKGWTNHPASRMWRGYETALAQYGVKICEEWIRRGYKDTMLQRFQDLTKSKNIQMPAWIGDRNFHRSHQSNLIRKDKDFYQPIFPDVPADLEYIWPVK
jgi:hypothetical protein